MKKNALNYLIFAAIVFLAAMSGCVKDGEDGKDGKDGKDGAAGAQGQPGEQGPAGPSNTFTVTINADNGSPTETQSVLSGAWAVEPQKPAKLNVAGLYIGADFEQNFLGWFKDGDTEPFDFDKPITANVTLKANWSASAPLDVSAQTGATNFEKAIAFARAYPAADRAYTLAIDDNYTVGAIAAISTANFNLTIIGLGADTIKYNGASSSSLFTLSAATASLTLGNNITLKGISNSTTSLVYVTAGTLTMEAGSKITGHTTNYTYGTVFVSGSNSRFIMNGGEISGNKSTGNSLWSSGVRIASSAILTMNGGKITGNTFGTAGGGAEVRPADLNLATDGTGTAILSGSAVIGVIKLGAGAANASITVNNYNPPSKPVIDLISGTSTDPITTVVSNWLNKEVLKGTLTAADVAKFDLGLFIGESNTATQPIGDTHIIANSGANIGKLIVKP